MPDSKLPSLMMVEGQVRGERSPVGAEAMVGKRERRLGKRRMGEKCISERL